MNTKREENDCLLRAAFEHYEHFVTQQHDSAQYVSYLENKTVATVTQKKCIIVGDWVKPDRTEASNSRASGSAAPAAPATAGVSKGGLSDVHAGLTARDISWDIPPSWERVPPDAGSNDIQGGWRASHNVPAWLT